MTRALIITALVFIVGATAAMIVGATAAVAFENDVAFDDPAMEARAVDLAKELRCLVCQNQSIMESDAPLARDLRQIVREQVAAGRSNDEIKEYVAARYGDFVLLRPPFKPKTWVLWFGPPLMVGGALICLFVFWRRRSTVPAAAAQGLSAEERKRLDRLLGDGRDG